MALRMAIQYWRLVGQPSRTEFLTLTESYHGDTVGSVSLGYSETFHRHVQPLVFPVLKTDPPHVFRFYRGMEAEAAEAAAIAAARDLIGRKPDQLAALIIEPMVQGAAGMLDALRALSAGDLARWRARRARSWSATRLRPDSAAPAAFSRPSTRISGPT